MELERQQGAGDSGSPNSETGNPERRNAPEKTKKIVSLRKIEANRRNALRSTGPRTRRGENFSRWNALEHGLLVQQVVLPAGPGQESCEEFWFLLEERIQRRKKGEPVPPAVIVAGIR